MDFDRWMQNQGKPGTPRGAIGIAFNIPTIPGMHKVVCGDDGSVKVLDEWGNVLYERYTTTIQGRTPLA